MTTRALTTTLAALCLSLLPLAASASCGHDEARMSCAAGTAWDEASRACIATTS